jgi:prephenate dehydrogenase
VSVGIIGYGRFGRLAAEIIGGYDEVLIWDSRRPSRAEQKRPGTGRVAWGSLEETAGQEFVLLAMPVSGMETVLRSAAPHFRTGALVADVCAVKRIPCSLLRRLIPRGVLAVGSHPLFGPDSFAGSLDGHRIILCPAQSGGAALARARGLLAMTGAVVEVMTPAAHDRLMAETVFLTQCVGRWLAEARQGRRTGATIHYDRLRSIIDVALNDSAELYRDMWRYNPATKEVVRKLGVSWRLMERSMRRAQPGPR